MQNWDGKLVAVIVSGYDGDGADALCGIKDVGGITIAQKPESAIASGCIDFVLSPQKIAKKIIRIAKVEKAQLTCMFLKHVNIATLYNSYVSFSDSSHPTFILC